MKSVGFECFARIFLSDVLKRTRAGHVDGQRRKQDHNGGDTGLDVHGTEEEPVKRFVNDVERGEEQ